ARDRIPARSARSRRARGRGVRAWRTRVRRGTARRRHVVPAAHGGQRADDVGTGRDPTTHAARAVSRRARVAASRGGCASCEGELKRATMERPVISRKLPRALAILAGVLAFGTLLTSASAGGKDTLANIGWGGFGNTP